MNQVVEFKGCFCKLFKRRNIIDRTRRRQRHHFLEVLEPRVMLASDLRITEFMASNSTAYADQSGAYPDWIEIYNASGAVVNLANWALTDDPGELSKWQFPAQDLENDDYLIVFASDNDISIADSELHTNFKLSASGEYLALVDHFGSIAYEYTPSYPSQNTDVSYGIGSDLGHYYFSDPTPGELNSTPQTEAPVFSRTGGLFASTFTLNVTATSPTAVVRYTTDLSLPTASSPVFPSSGLSISSTKQLRVQAYESGFAPSEVVAETYVKSSDPLNSFSSNLPIVVLEDFGAGDPDRETTLPAYMALYEPDPVTGRVSLDQPQALDTRIGIHARGNTTYTSQPKHSYRIEAWSDGVDDDHDIQPVEMAPDSDWILYGPMDQTSSGGEEWDKTLIRNTLMYELVRDMGYYAVDTQFVELYFDFNSDQALDLSVTGNDYRGLYVLMETIKFDENRIDMPELTDENGTTEGAFIIEYSQRAYADKYSLGSRLYVESPSLENLSAAENSYISSTVNAFKTAVKSSSYTNYLDTQTWIDYHIPVAFASDPDGMNLSTFYVFDETGFASAGPEWDFDRTMGGDPRSTTAGWRGTTNEERTFGEGWWTDIFSKAAFRQSYVDRWAEVREDYFNTDYMFAIIDRQAAEIAEAQARDFLQWNPGKTNDYADEIQKLKDWITARFDWTDAQFLPIPEFSEPAGAIAPGTSVTITTYSSLAAGQSIYYTLDGTDPFAPGGSPSASAILYAGENIPITETTTLWARIKGINAWCPKQYGTVDWSAPARQAYMTNTLASIENVAITEINYHPVDPNMSELSDDASLNEDNCEFVEITNISAGPVDIAGLEFTSGITFDFLDSPVLTLAAGDAVVVVSDIDGFETRYGSGLNVAGVFEGQLSNDGERIALLDLEGNTIMDFVYDDNGKWPGRADGDGSSLELEDSGATPLADPERTAWFESGDRWRSSSEYGGSPGAEGTGPDNRILINEVLSHSDDPYTDTIELYNPTDQIVTFSGVYLSDQAGVSDGFENLKKRWLPGFSMPAGSYAALPEIVFNPTGGASPTDFALNGAHGDDVYLTEADPSGKILRFIDHVDFGAAITNVSFGRWPNGEGSLYPMSALTLGSENSEPRLSGSLVISEVYYNSAEGSDVDDFEFVEIYNPTGAAIDLTDWRVRGGVDYDFIASTSIGAYKTLVLLSFNPDLAENTARVAAFRGKYQIGLSVDLVGGYDGALDNDGGNRIQLQRPDTPDEFGYIPHLYEDEVDYEDAAPWPLAADGQGDSLTRVWTNRWGNYAATWTASKPTPGTFQFNQPLVGDVNGSDEVDGADLNLLLSSLGSTGYPGLNDTDSDGDVDGNDLNILLHNFGVTTPVAPAPPVVAVPIGPIFQAATDATEPATGPQHSRNFNFQFTAISRPRAKTFSRHQENFFPRERARVHDAALIAAIQAEQQTPLRKSQQPNRHTPGRWGEQVDWFFGRSEKEEFFRISDRP